MKPKYPKVSYEVIEEATKEDVEAIYEVINHFDRYILKLSLRPLIDEQGHFRMEVDEVLYGRILSRLMKQITTFDIYRD
jgi:hypothetical protein